MTQDVTISFTLTFRAQTMTVFPGAHVDHLELRTRDAPGAVDLGGAGLWDGTGNPGNRWDALEVVMFDTETFTTTVLAGITGSSAPTGDPGFMDAIPIEKKWTNLRLGATIKDGALIYSWFADTNSVYTLTVNGSVADTVAGGAPSFATTSRGGAGAGYQGQGPILNFQVGRINTFFVPTPGESHYEHVRFDDFVGNGAALTPPYVTEFKIVAGPGSTSFSSGLSHSFGASFRYTLDLDCDETSGSAVAADYSHTEAGSGTCPDAATSEALFFDGSGFEAAPPGHVVPAAVLADPWLSAQDVRPYDADLSFRFEGNAPADPTLSTPTYFSVGSIEIESPVTVLRSSNAWATDAGSVVITGTPTEPIFTVSAEPAIVRRELAEHWRDWNNPLSGDFEPSDGFQVTKHDFFASGAADDVWGFGAYALLDIDMTVPAGDDTLLNIEITWAVLRGTSTVDTITLNYSLDVAGNPLTFPAGGRSTQRIDLMFPTTLRSRPFYGERVDRIRLVGLLTGATTLHALDLVADEDAYVTLMGRRATLRDGTVTHTGIVIAQDGSAPSLLWGRDAAVNPLPGDLDLDGWQDYRGDHQNGAFVVNQVTQEHPGKAPGMLAGTLQATLDELNRMEGVTATYDGSGVDAAFTDGDGNTIGIDASGNPSPPTRGADWFLPTLPAARVAPNTPYDVRAQLVVEGVVVPAGVDPAELRVFQRNHLGAVLEALATDSDYFRHGAGVPVVATAYTGGAPAAGDLVLATENTDASGFVLLPVRTGTRLGLQANFILGA